MPLSPLATFSFPAKPAMTYTVQISDLDTIIEDPAYWTETKLRALLDAYSVENVEELATAELRDYLALVTSDLEPAEAAMIALRYAFTEDELSEGQIEQIAHDMLIDKVVEEYPEIGFHERLWHVNQLLYKAYNGKFPNTKASVISCTLTPAKDGQRVLAKADLLQLLAPGLRGHAILPRLYEERLAGTVPFPEAESILWQSEDLGQGRHRLMTSEYWLSSDDFGATEFEATLANEE